MHRQAMVDRAVRDLIRLLFRRIIYLRLRVLLAVLTLLLKLLVLRMLVLALLWDQGLLLVLMLLLSITPALHHWVFSGSGLPQAMICLDRCDITSWIWMRSVYVTDGNGPSLAPIVLLRSRVVVVSKIVGCQADTGHNEGCVRTSASWPISNDAVRGDVVEETQLEGGAEKGKEQGDREDRAAGEKVRRKMLRWKER